MSEADYYPTGSYSDPDAPWNQPMIPGKDYSVTVSQTLSKSVTVFTDQYKEEVDEDGHVFANTEDTDWRSIYGEQHMTILELLAECKSKLETLMDTPIGSKEHKRIAYLIAECESWVEDDFAVNED